MSSHSRPVGAALAATAMPAGHPGGLQSTRRALALEFHLLLLAQWSETWHLDDALYAYVYNENYIELMH